LPTARINLYIDDATQQRLREAATRHNVSQSQFVAELVRRATVTEWPAEVAALAESIPDLPGAQELRTRHGRDAKRAPW